MLVCCGVLRWWQGLLCCGCVGEYAAVWKPCWPLDALCCVLWWCWGLTVLCVLVSVLPSGSLGGPWLHFATSVGVAATEVNRLNNFVLLSCGVPVTPCPPCHSFCIPSSVVLCCAGWGERRVCLCSFKSVCVCGECWAGACSTLV